MDSAPQTLQQAIQYFSDYENCHNFMVSLRWPDGTVRCPVCGSEKVTFLAKPRVWKCYQNHPKPRFSLKTGTVFEDSPLGLDKWLPVLWMLVNCKNGVSSYEIHRSIGVTQKTAWFMLQRARLALQGDNSTEMFGGEVEVDETFIGGKVRNMHSSKRKAMGDTRGRHTEQKTIVMGLLERGGRVRTKIVGDTKRPTLQGAIRENIAAGSTVYTDEHVSYYGLDGEYAHCTSALGKSDPVGLH